MKKSLVAFLAVALVVGFYGMVQADTTATSNITVSASVTKCVTITPTTASIEIPAVSGLPGANIDGSTSVTIQTNCDAKITVTNTILTLKPNGPDTIPTTVKMDGTVVPGTGVSVLALHNAAHTISVHGEITNVYGQTAGNYGCGITVTVAAN